MGERDLDQAFRRENAEGKRDEGGAGSKPRGLARPAKEEGRRGNA